MAGLVPPTRTCARVSIVFGSPLLSCKINMCLVAVCVFCARFALCDLVLSECVGYGQVLPDYRMPDIIGSPYAVVDYVTNPDIGTDADVINLRVRLNSMGMRLMLDFVPNHSAVDCAYFPFS